MLLYAQSGLAKLMNWAYGTKRLHRLMYRYLDAPPFDVREREYQRSFEYLKNCESVLDVACGTGTFLEAFPKKSVGIDLNPDNVAYCKSCGLNAVEGSATKLPFEDNCFDGLHCSHLLQAMMPDQVVAFLVEAGRVVKNEGVIVISTLNWFHRFFRHPENVRPYPPDALLRLCQIQKGSTSPMYSGVPEFEQEAIWFRNPPLVEFEGLTPQENMWLWRLNPLQLKYGIVKFWNYDSYVIKLRLSKTEANSE